MASFGCLALRAGHACRHVLSVRPALSLPNSFVRPVSRNGFAFHRCISSNELPPGTTITAKTPQDVMKGKLVDVQGGKLGDDDAFEEGHLHIAERAKNILCANKRFQLATYNNVPSGPDDHQSYFSDGKEPVRGSYHPRTGRIVLFLDSKPSDRRHVENVKKISFSSISTGHVDPKPLMPIFTRVGVLPPVVRMVGDLEPTPEAYDEELRKLMGLAKDAVGDFHWMEPLNMVHVNIFEKRSEVNMRDFNSAKPDFLCSEVHELIHHMNTVELDWLPRFVENYKGHPLNEGFFYDIDRKGFSIFGWQKDTENLWREYRFQFTDELESKEDFLQNVELLKTGIREAGTKH